MKVLKLQKFPIVYICIYTNQMTHFIAFLCTCTYIHIVYHIIYLKYAFEIISEIYDSGNNLRYITLCGSIGLSQLVECSTQQKQLYFSAFVQVNWRVKEGMSHRTPVKGNLSELTSTLALKSGETQKTNMSASTSEIN